MLARIRTISAEDITAAVRELCITACCTLPCDVEQKLQQAYENESWPVAHDVLGTILENVDIAKRDMVPLCQDTGLACVFVELGQDVHIDGDLREAINEGVRQGYTEGYLRKSVVGDPLERTNTQDNTPALITFNVVPGNQLKIVLAPKGAGSENMGKLAMLTPAVGREGVIDAVLDAVRAAGPNACPPLVVGVGIGGNSDHVLSVAKRALLHPLGSRHNNPLYAELEEELLARINELGCGPQGLGGATTALDVHVEVLPTHIACLPVAVALNCHVARHAEVVL